MSPRPLPPWAVGALLLVLTAVNAAADCKYRLEINSANSTLGLSGTSTLLSPNGNAVDADVVYPPTAAPLGFQGPLYLVISNTTTCPNTTQALLATAPKWRVSSFASWADPSLLHVYPDTIPALVATFPFTVSALAFNVTSTRVVALGRTVAMTLAVEIAQGYVYTDNPTTGKNLNSLAGYKNTTTITGTLDIVEDAASNSTVLRMRMDDLSLQFAMTTAEIRGTAANYSGRALLQLKGSLRAQAVMDCPNYCGDHGVCQVLKGTPGCVCECGWSAGKDGSCTVPAGFCPLTGPVSSVQYLTTPAATTPAAPAAAPAAAALVPLSEDGSCPEGYSFSAADAACARCPAGFTGASCALCLTDDACKAATGSSSATCRRELTYEPRTRNKAYSCALTSKSLSSILGPTVEFACHTTPPPGSESKGTITGVATGTKGAQDVIGSTAYCELNLTIADMGPGRPVNCTTWDCRFSDSSPDARCGVTRCSCFKNDCQGKNTDYTKLFAAVKGGAAVTCDATDSSCQLKLDDLPITVDLTCRAAECLVPESAATVGKAAKVKVSTRDRRLISLAAVPVLLLLAMSVLLLVLLVSQWAYMRASSSTTPNPTNSAAAYTLSPDEEHSGAVQAGPQVVAGPPVPVVAKGVDGTDASNGSTTVLVNTGATGVVHELGFWDIKVSHQPRTLRSMLRMRGSRGDKGQRATSDTSSGSDDFQIQPLLTPNSKPILHGVSACAKRGQVLGVLGPSGSGKSTLLGVLTGQVSNHGPWQVTGRLALDGAAVGARAVARVAALVPQDDHLLRCLTVAECLCYSAALRLDVRLSPAEVRAQVDAVLKQLGLYHLRDRRVYNAGGDTGVSGGERRRVSIGMELVIRPRVLVLDEATSGLDSFSAASLVKLLRGVASASDCVVALSIHQPSPAIFSMLDQVLLLALGRQLFFGAPADAAAALARLGAPCPSDIPVAEHLLDVACDPERLMPLLATIAALPPPPAPPTSPRADQTLIRALSADVLTLKYRSRRTLRELGILFWRAVVDMWRNPGLLLMHWAVGILMGLLIGAIFYDVNNNLDGAQNRVGAVFFAISLMGFTSITSCDLLHSEQLIVERECRRRYYSPLSYMTTKVVLDSLVLRAVPAVLFGGPFYWLMGLRPQLAAYFIFQFVLIAFTSAAGALALTLTALLRTPGRTIVVMNLVLLVGVLFAGFLANINSITPALRWLSWLSLFRYAWEAIVVNEFTAITLDIVLKNLPAVPTVRGTLFLEIIGVRTDMLATDIAVMVGLYFAFFALALLTLHLRVRYS